MTIKEAKEVFLNRGFVNGLFDGDEWRQSIVVISKWLEQEPTTERIECGTDGNPYVLSITNGKELEKEPCDDCISRVEVNAVIDKWIRDNKLHYIIPKELNRLYGLLDNIGGAE